ncbi:hypothetical protein WBG78_20435 [Chryseolinea sp. T2]|uniref:hypothetical protein n=1 Tax=Chryseolinea sp. T2 TaxID=3129255 RepID=UPI003078196F
MSVLFGFRAFENKNSEHVDELIDYGKEITNDALSIPSGLWERAVNLGEPDDFDEFLNQIKDVGVTKEDLDFLIHVNDECYTGTPRPYFFPASTVAKAFANYATIFKSPLYTRILIRDKKTGEPFRNPLSINGAFAGYCDYVLQKNRKEPIRTIAIVKEADDQQVEEPVEFELTYETLYETLEDDFKSFQSFFEKCAANGYLIQAFWC